MAFKYIGTSSTIITDGGVENPTINGVVVTTKNEGDIVFYTDKRFLWTSNAWKYQGDINTHTDVQDALNAIMEAYKGEEVRGSIYDAIALIDTRSTAMEEIVGGNVDSIVETKIPTFDVTYVISGGVVTCNRTYEDIKTKIDSGKKPLFYIISPSASDPSILIRHACTVNFTEETYDGGYFYRIHLYYIDANSSYLRVYRNRVLHYSARIHLDSSNEYSIPIGGGGGSYTEGDGIDITNDEISVKLRSSNPGLAFTNDGELYATGSGGDSYTAGDGIDITNDTISADAVRCKLRIDQQGNVTSSISGDILYALINETASIYEGHTVVFDVSIANRGSFSNLQAEHNTIQEGGIRLHFHEVTNTNSGYVIYEFAVVLPSSGYTGTCTHSTINIQPKLTAGTGISIDPTTNTISLDLPQAEGGGF